MSKRTEPMLRSKWTDENRMSLPQSKTCADCGHFPRCSAIFGHIATDEVCDFWPSRFIDREPKQ